MPSFPAGVRTFSLLLLFSPRLIHAEEGALRRQIDREIQAAH